MIGYGCGMVLRTSAAVAGLVFGVCPVVLAEQFVLVDEAYIHSEDTTSDSHFYPELPTDTPKNWVEPIDYAGGSVHIVADVKTKPAGDAPTKLQICFEATPAAACTLQSPTYTKSGRIEWDSPFDDFWYESTVDWAKGIRESPVILKDDMNNKPAGDPKYMPTDLHVQVTLVSKGAKFVATSAAGSGGTAGGAAGSGAAGVGGVQSGAGGASSSAGRDSAAGGGAGANTRGGAGASVGGAGSAIAAQGGKGGVAGRGGVAGVRAADAGLSASQQTGTVRAEAAGTSGASAASAAEQPSSGGCRAAGQGSGAGWVPLTVFAWWTTRRRTRAARAK